MFLYHVHGFFLFHHTVPNASLPVYTQAMPLPTYSQSEKYEREGILEYESDSACDEEQERSPEEVSGTCCEFTFFFLSEFTNLSNKWHWQVICHFGLGSKFKLNG